MWRLGRREEGLLGNGKYHYSKTSREQKETAKASLNAVSSQTGTKPTFPVFSKVMRKRLLKSKNCLKRSILGLKIAIDIILRRIPLHQIGSGYGR
jgi:hypothetical protein